MKRCFIVMLGALFGATFFAAAAHAHGVIGKRFIPSTLTLEDPFPSDEMDLLSFQRSSKNKQGRETSVGFEFSPATAELVPAAAQALGLVTAAPPARSSYDHVVVLGGLAPACLQRTAYAAHLVRAGLKTTTMAALGSFRTLGDHERAVLGETAEFEVDAMEIGVQRAFHADQPVHRRGSTGAVERTSSPPLELLLPTATSTRKRGRPVRS